MSILEKIEEKGIETGLQRGIARGMERGRLEEKKEIARNLLNQGIEIALVAKATGLSKEEIERL